MFLRSFTQLLQLKKRCKQLSLVQGKRRRLVNIGVHVGTDQNLECRRRA